MATGAEQRSLESFRPHFGEARADGTGIDRPFLFHAHAVDLYLLEIVVSDFGAHTYRCCLSVEELDEMRDNIGVGGPWSEFIDYVAKSLASDDVTILLDDSWAAGADAVTAKLTAHKGKGMPRITFSLGRLLNSSASESIAKLSVALFRSFKEITEEIMKEQDQNMQLSRQLSSVKERNEELQKQLDAYTFKKKRALSKSKMPDKTHHVPEDASSFEGVLDSKSQQPSDVKSSNDSPSNKRSLHIVRARKAKARGAVLQDDGDNTDI